jgi:hypothetical protein
MFLFLRFVYAPNEDFRKPQLVGLIATTDVLIN